MDLILENNMQALRRLLGSLFSDSLLLGALKNDIAHILVEFESANARVKEAFAYAEEVRQLEAEDFDALKQRTIERTKAAVTALKDGLLEESAVFEDNYVSGRAAIDTKFQSADSLHSKIESLTLEDHKI